MPHRFLTVIIALFSVFTIQAAHAKDPVYTKAFSNLAVEGYDPVAYFTMAKPTRGLKEFTYRYNGAEWRFANAENLATFKSAPAAYAPQYGGYCAWAVSQNYTARGNPNNWRIENNKLYLNYNTKIQERWEKDIPGFIALADANWPGVIE